MSCGQDLSPLMTGTGSQTLLPSSGLLQRLRDPELPPVGLRGSRAALASSRAECEPRDAAKKVAGALRAASSQPDISGGRAGFRGIVLWEKAPASLPTLSQARTLPWRGKPLCGMSSCPGMAVCVVLLCTLVFTPSRGRGPAASRGTAEHRGLFLGAAFRPARCAGELGFFGLEPDRARPGLP